MRGLLLTTRRSASHATTAACAPAANMRVQRDARGRWQRHRRHQHLHRSSRADGPTAVAATVAAHIATAAAASCAGPWLLPAGTKIPTTAAGASFLSGRTLLAVSEAATSSAFTLASAAALAALAPSQSARAAVSAAGFARTAVSAAAAASNRALGRMVSPSACGPAVAAVGAAAARAAAVLPDGPGLRHRLRRGRRVRGEHDGQRRGGARQVQTV